MKKLFYFMLLLLLYPGIIFAKANYTRSFADTPTSSIVVDIAAQDYDADINCGGLAFWGIQAIEHETGNRFSGNPRFVSSAILSQRFTIDVPTGNYEEMTFICSDNGEDEAFQFGSIENDLTGDEVIFSAVDAPAPTIDIIDSGATPDPNFIPNTPLPDPAPAVPAPETTPAPVIQENEDGSITVDIIDSGATPVAPLPDSTPVVPAPEPDSTSSPQATPAPIIQQNEDGSTTIIAI